MTNTTNEALKSKLAKLSPAQLRAIGSRALTIVFTRNDHSNAVGKLARVAFLAAEFVATKE